MVAGKVKDFYISLNMVILCFSYKLFILKWTYPCIFCWIVMIVSFDTRAYYDITFEDQVTHGWWGLDDKLRDEIKPLVFYLCFVLVGPNLGLRYIHGFMLYLFPKWDPSYLFEIFFMMFWWCSAFGHKYLYV